jgi:regulatory protein
VGEGHPPAARSRGPSREARREQHAAAEDVGEVLDAAARFLETRPRSVAEVRRRLTTAGYPAPLVEASIQRLGELGYLDDQAFARTWVESRDRARPRGEHALRRELRLKGVDPAIIDAVLEDRRSAGAGELDGGDEVAVDVDRAAADRLLERQARALARVADPRARRQRAYALLARNGFDPSVASEAARAFVAEGEE